MALKIMMHPQRTTPLSSLFVFGFFSFFLDVAESAAPVPDSFIIILKDVKAKRPSQMGVCVQ